MITPGTRDNDVLPSSGNSASSGLSLDYSALNMGGIDNGVPFNHADDGYESVEVNESEDGGSFVGKSEEGFPLRHNLDYGSTAGLTALIIKGNAKFIMDNATAEEFYDAVSNYLQGLGYKVSFDVSETKDLPHKADLIIGHSNGLFKLNRCKDNAKLIAIGAIPEKATNPKIIFANHPIDEQYLKKCHATLRYDYPIPEHFIFTNEMKIAINKATIEIWKKAFPDYQQYNGNPQMYDQVTEGIDAVTTPHFNMWNTYYANDDEYNLPSLSDLKAILPQLTQAAQKIYDGWIQDEDDELSGGGICHLIADAMCEEMSRIGIECATVSYSIGEVHVASVAKLSDGVYTVDIPPSLYETGGGYTWHKRPDIKFEPDYISITKESANPDDFPQYINDANDKRAWLNLPQYSDPERYEQVGENPHNTMESEFNIFETYFADDGEDKPKKPFSEFIAELRAKQQLVNDRIAQIIGTGQATHKFSDKNGNDIIVHPSTRRPGKWQMTWFSGSEPVGHLDCETQAEALKEAHKMGADLMTTKDEIETVENDADQVEAHDESGLNKKAFLKMAVTYDSHPIIQDLIKIPQVKALIDQEASGFVDKIIVTTPGADIQQTQQQLSSTKPTGTGIAPITLQPISGDPFGHVWVSEDPTTHQKKPLDKIVRVDKVTDQWGTLVTILHEIAHHRHPDWSESQVESEAENHANTVKQFLGGTKNASGKTNLLFAKRGLHSLPLVQCDLADTYQKQVIGLQNHSSLRPQHGLLFTYSTPQPLTFWMGKVSFPIDIIFADSNNKIIKICRNCQPNSSELYSCNNASKVIEVVGSFCAFHDIDVGDHVFYADDREEGFTQHTLESIKEAKLAQQEDLDMTDWNIKIVMRKVPDSRRFLKVSWTPEDYRIKKAEILVNPDPELIREALKEMPLEKLVRHALLHILAGAKNELPEDKEQKLITNRLY